MALSAKLSLSSRVRPRRAQAPPARGSTKGLKTSTRPPAARGRLLAPRYTSVPERQGALRR
jgi:hypothetical protein